MEITSYLLGKKAGGTQPTGEIDITTNGITNVSGYATANVSVQPTLQNKSVPITTNGSTSVSADENYDGLGTVSITTNVQPNLETKSITITENTTTTITPTTGKDGLSSVEVITNVSAGGNYNATIDESKFESGKYFYMAITELPELDLSTVDGPANYFLSSIPNITTINLKNTNNITSMNYLFAYCNNLENINVFDTSKVRDMKSFVENDLKLTDTSLDNILQMCANVSSSYMSVDKKLTWIGITNTTVYPASRIQALPHYQDFIDAGWTIS